MTATELSDWQDRPLAPPPELLPIPADDDPFPPASNDIAARVCQLLESAYDLVDEHGPKDWSVLAVHLADLTLIGQTVGFLKDALAGALHSELPEYEVTMEGVGTFTRSSGTKRTHWDHERVTSAIAAKVAGELTEDGNHMQDAGKVAEHVATAMRRCAGVAYWRVGELKGLGLRADSYCDKEPGRPTVIFRAS